MNPEHFGKWLLSLGFKGWFLYMFRAIEQTAFVVEPIHADLFDSFEKILGNTYKRLNINIPPRSAKTTLAIYFIIYTWLLNPKANFIYTSFSQSLLNDIAVRMRNILESPIYKSMYANFVNFESEEANPIDDFWLEYLKKETGKNTYSTKKITTAHGGICLFSSIGSQITGYGAGIRNGKGFTGALIIDDANKPADVHSAVMRNKVERYFEETLLSRLNNSNVPIVNIQQRLHINDISGILEKKYHFETLKKPLLDENGICQLPKQYSPQRIEELMINSYMFSSQYQQEPMSLDGLRVFTNVVKRKITEEEIRRFDRIVEGIDWGYSVDPFVFIKSHYDRKHKFLFIFDEIYQVGLSNDDAIEKVIQKHTKSVEIIADSEEPKSIDEFDNAGLPIRGAKKGPGSVNFGIKKLQGLKSIIIDPERCPNAYREFSEYAYDQNKDGTTKSMYPDKDNHTIDGTRYSLEDEFSY